MAPLTQPQQPDWHSHHSNQIQTLVQSDALPRFDHWLCELQTNVPEQWEPWEHAQLLHGKSPSGANFFTIERNYASVITKMTPAELDEWRAKDPKRRGSVSRNSAWRARSWQTKRLGVKGDPDFFMMAHLDEVAREPDVYMSMAEFGNPGWYGPQMRRAASEKAAGVPVEERTRVLRFARNAENAHHLNCVWMDIDNLENHNLDHIQASAAFLAYAEDNNAPLPSFIMFTGRGICPVWVLNKHHNVNRAKGSIRARWVKVMENLYRKFEIFQPDPKVIDLARVLRLAGTINSKSGELVRPIFVNRHDHGLVRYIFNDLADMVLPLPREQYLAMKHAMYEANGRRWAKERDKRQVQKRENVVSLENDQAFNKKHSLGLRSRHRTIIDDLDKLWAARWKKGHVEAGYRDTWLFLRTCSQAHLEPISKIEETIKTLGRKIGLGEHIASNNMSSLLARAQEQVIVNQALADGKDPATLKLDHHNPSYDFVIYTYSRKTIIQQLNITEREMRDLDLRMLITPKLKAERDRTRKAKERGQKTAPRSRIEIKATALKEAQELRNRMDAEGWSIRKAASELGMSKSAVSRLLAHLQADVPVCPC